MTLGGLGRVSIDRLVLHDHRKDFYQESPLGSVQRYRLCTIPHRIHLGLSATLSSL